MHMCVNICEKLTRGPWALSLLENQLGHLPKFQNLHIYSISTSGVEIELIFSLWVSSFRGTWRFSKLPYLGMKKFNLFSLYGLRFPSYGPIFKIAIFGHETSPLAKVPEVAHIPSFYPKASKLSLFFLYGYGFRDTGQFSKLSYLAMKHGHQPKLQKLHI